MFECNMIWVLGDMITVLMIVISQQIYAATVFALTLVVELEMKEVLAEREFLEWNDCITEGGGVEDNLRENLRGLPFK